jgi:hypothetical protein
MVSHDAGAGALRCRGVCIVIGVAWKIWGGLHTGIADRGFAVFILLAIVGAR